MLHQLSLPYSVLTAQTSDLKQDFRSMALSSLMTAITIHHFTMPSRAYALSNFTLINDTLMPHSGERPSVYVNETSQEIWLFSLDTKMISIYITTIV